MYNEMMGKSPRSGKADKLLLDNDEANEIEFLPMIAYEQYEEKSKMSDKLL
jgi:hypothetical protein